jgi:hypothetical protein
MDELAKVRRVIAGRIEGASARDSARRRRDDGQNGSSRARLFAGGLRA